MDVLGLSGLDTGAANRVAQSLATPVSATSAAKAAATATATTSSSSTDGSDITSNDFLTLLVTEMKNQDPTQPTDPNAYIQQLVGVNSLQQLIAINQELGNATSSTSATSSGVNTDPISPN